MVRSAGQTVASWFMLFSWSVEKGVYSLDSHTEGNLFNLVYISVLKFGTDLLQMRRL